MGMVAREQVSAKRADGGGGGGGGGGGDNGRRSYAGIPLQSPNAIQTLAMKTITGNNV